MVRYVEVSKRKRKSYSAQDDRNMEIGTNRSLRIIVSSFLLSFSLSLSSSYFFALIVYFLLFLAFFYSFHSSLNIHRDRND